MLVVHEAMQSPEADRWLVDLASGLGMDCR